MKSLVWRLPKTPRTLLALALWLVMSGCSVLWISPYSKEAADRVSDLSKSVLGMYQELLLVEPSKRATTMAASTKAKQADVETRMRIHLLQEQARPKNSESIRIASNMLESWQKFGANRGRADPTVFSDDSLGAERQIMERHLGAAMKAEEAKKLAGP